MKELWDWEKSLEETKSELNQTKSQTVSEKKKPAENRIKSFEYDKWDKFDVDQALEEVDYSPTATTHKATQSKMIVSVEEALFEKEKVSCQNQVI